MKISFIVTRNYGITAHLCSVSFKIATRVEVSKYTVYMVSLGRSFGQGRQNNSKLKDLIEANRGHRSFW